MEKIKIEQLHIELQVSDIKVIFCISANARTLVTGTMANSEDPDELMIEAVFHQGLHCLLRRNPSSEKKIQ